LFFNNWSLEPHFGGVFSGPTYAKDTADLKARNAARKLWQRIGLGLILASFILQGTAQFFD
jgi:hypothetical protein